MKVSCPSCQTNYNIDDKRIPPGGAKLKCARCQTSFPIKVDAVSAPAQAAAIPLPGAAPQSAAIPLPGAAPQSAAIPLPGAAPQSAAIPLPGAAPQSAIPLPGATSYSEAIPRRPGAAPQADAFGFADGASAETSAAIPLPGTEPSSAGAIPLDMGAIPLPGTAAPRATAIPLPRSAPQSAAIPLPGAASQATPIPLTASAPRADAIPLSAAPAAIPLPGAAPRAAAIPMPGAAPASQPLPLPGAAPEADPFSFDSGASFEAPAAIALPGVTSPRAEAIPLPGAASPMDAFREYDNSPAPETEDVTRVVRMRLPSDAYREPPPAVPTYGTTDAPRSTARDFDFSEEPPAPLAEAPQAYGTPAVPDTARDFDFSDDALPVPAQAEPAAEPFAFDIASQSGEPQAFALPPPPDAYAQPPMGADDPFALPPPPDAGTPSFDFGEVPASGGENPFALPPPPMSGPMDYSDLPSPAEPQAQAMDFSDLPAPAAPPQDLSFDFAEVPASPGTDPFAVDFPAPSAAPAPAPDLNLDFAEPPPPAASFNPTVNFGDVDFGSPPPAAAPGIPDALEFDPSAGPTDDLEADLSKPLPPSPNTGPADGLEMLSFIDDAGRNAGVQAGAKVRRFHVRRRSGKVFGPFDEGVIVKMLEDGQLLGNEDVSTDSESWSPIGTIPTFASAIQQLMEGPDSKMVAPATAPTTVNAEAPRADSTPQASMKRLEQLYEGRMAGVAVVDRSGAAEKWKKRIPMMVAAGVGLVVLGIGAGMEFGSRYGAFGRRAIFPARVSAGSPQAKQVEEARQALLQDTFDSYKQAHALSAQVLQQGEYPAVRSLWCQSVHYLQRRYAAADPNEMARCRLAMPDIELLGAKDVDVIKAAAAIALTSRQTDTVLPALADASSREANQGDLELAFLLAEAYSQRREEARALEVLTTVLKRDAESAKAHHALGNLHQTAGRADEAVAAYTAALVANPKHASSAVELAAVELLVRKDGDKGAQAVDRALAEDVQSALGPAELARARSLKGVALFQQHKPKEAEAELKSALEKDPDSAFTKAQLARVLRAQHNYEEALELYTQLATKEPENLEYVDGHITAMVMTGKMQLALDAVKKANERFPSEARIAYLYGRIEDALNTENGAEGHYKRAIAADGKLVEARLYLGRFYLRQRRNAEARTQLEQAASTASDHPGVRSGLGELALAENNALLGQQEFERAVQLDPTLADAHLGLSRVALLAGDLEQAKSHANRALELDPYLLKDGRLQRGIVLWRLGQLDEAVTELEKAKTEDPRSTTTPITLGAVMLEKGDLAGAESNLGLALSNEPSNHEALYYLGLVKAKRLEFTGAVDYMRKAVERAPSRPDYRYAYGVILRDAKNLPDAMAEWRKVVELDPQNADAHEALGHALMERGAFEEAIAAFEASMKADPRRTRVLGSIGDAYFSAARWNDAVKRYQTALQEDPKLTYVYYKVARAFSEQAQHAKAIDWYRKATSADPENPMSYYYLGYAYKERHKRREAVQAFKEYLSRKPDATDKKDIEDEIYDLLN